MALDALVVGDNCIDRYLPPVDAEFVGGQAVNVAAGLAAQGFATAYAGVVGSDAAGTRIADELRRRGVDLRVLDVRDGATGLTVIATEGGEREFVAEAYGVSAPYVPTYAALALAREARLVYAAHVDDLGGLRAALRTGAELAYDAADGPLAAATLANVDVLFRSVPGMDPDEAEVLAVGLLALGPSVVVATLGPDGAVACSRNGDRAACAPAGPVAVDTLGAGDALAAGFIAARLRGASLPDALAAGTTAAHAACGHLGALPAW